MVIKTFLDGANLLGIIIGPCKKSDTATARDKCRFARRQQPLSASTQTFGPVWRSVWVTKTLVSPIAWSEPLA